jgi:Tfp pilus assembly protein PilF
METSKVGKVNRAVAWLIGAALAVATVALYWQVGGHDFTNVDDRLYVSENEYVLAGLTWRGIVWAFTNNLTGNWHPLTWLSLMLDCQLFENRAAACHLTNMALHVANTLLLFTVLRQMTRALWPSALVAALFAVHPVHVESVAWVSERKDVLSTLFWLLTMWAYARYAARRSVSRYAWVLLFFALGLMSKSMLVTLPFVLLLLDFWPLGRFGFEQLSRGEGRRAAVGLIFEKLPLFFVTVVSSAVAFYFQRGAGAVLSVELLGPGARMAHAAVTYFKYLGKMIWPTALQVHYRHHGVPPAWQTSLAVLVLVGVLVAAVWLRKRYPYLLVGWLWYVGTLVPVIGLVQIGAQSMADRYTYVPSIGVCVMLAWGAWELGARVRGRAWVLAASAAVVLAALSIQSYRQIGHWRNSFTLHGHAVEVAPDNYHAHMGLGMALDTAGRLDEAIEHYGAVLETVPGNSVARLHMARAFERQARPDRAIEVYRAGLEFDPDHDGLRGGLARALNNLGTKTLKAGGDANAAMAYFEQAIEVRPDYIHARMNLANQHFKSAAFDAAAEHCRKALELDPNHSGAQNLLESIRTLQEARESHPERSSEPDTP